MISFQKKKPEAAQRTKVLVEWAGPGFSDSQVSGFFFGSLPYLLEQFRRQIGYASKELNEDT